MDIIFINSTQNKTKEPNNTPMTLSLSITYVKIHLSTIFA